MMFTTGNQGPRETNRPISSSSYKIIPPPKLLLSCLGDAPPPVGWPRFSIVIPIFFVSIRSEPIGPSWVIKRASMT